MKKILAGICVLVFTINAKAQEKFNGDSIAFLQEMHREADNLRLPLIKASYTPFKSKLSSFITNIAVTSTLNAGENAQANINYAIKDSSFVAGLFVSQQIGKDDQQATPFSFADGLSSGSTVGLNLKFIGWKPKLSSSAFKDFTSAAEAFVGRMNADGNTRSVVDKRYLTYQSIREHGNKAERDLLPRLKNPFFFNLKASITKTSFSYATDSVLLTATTVNHLQPDIALAAGWLCSPTSYLAFGYVFSSTFTAADPQTFNTPFGNSGNFVSQILVFGQPARTNDSKLSMQWSKLFGRNGSCGISPSLTYGIASKLAAITFPVYFIKGLTSDNKPNGLQGGIQLGYLTGIEKSTFASFKDGFGAQLILGVPFDVFANMR